jgi:hypothetical protein
MLEAQSLCQQIEQTYPFVGLVEPPIYAYWLGAFLNPSNFEPQAVSVYAAVMSVSMPFCWFLWMRNQFSNELYAVLGLAVFTWMPSFMGIYCFFQPESLLLLLLPLSLWLADSLLFKPGLRRSAVVGTAWGLTLATRLTAIPLFAVSSAWTGLKLSRKLEANALLKFLAIEIFAMALVYTVVPIKIFIGTGFPDLTPGMVNFNRILYESGADGVIVHVKYKNKSQKIIEEDVPIATPVRPGMYYQNMLNDQFSEWSSIRHGIQKLEVDYTKPDPYKNVPKITFENRMRLWKENLFLLFASSSWPENDRRGTLFSIETYLNRIWGPLFLLTGSLILLFRVRTLPTILFSTLMLTFVLQQTSIIEGRYRKPLECMTVVALIDIIRIKLPKKSSLLNF